MRKKVLAEKSVKQGLNQFQLVEQLNRNKAEVYLCFFIQAANLKKSHTYDILEM